jgi:hypothetical protein
MAGPPHIIAARRDHDFRVVECTAPFPYKNALKEEGRWLALEWWGNCFVEGFQGAVGHFCSSVEPDFFLLMLVLRGPVAPDRFVVYLRDEEYKQFGYDPFRALQGGVFDFTESFYTSRGESRSHDDLRSSVPVFEELSEPQRMRYAVASQHLGQGTSIVVPTAEDGRELRMEFARFTHSVQPELLRKINICTFTNSARDNIDHFGTLLCGWYDMTRNETFGDVVDRLVTLDGNGSPFKVIRREADAKQSSI